MSRKECIAVLKESPMPTRWMRAYVTIYLVALFVQIAIFQLRFLIPLLSGSHVPSSESFRYAFVLVAVGMTLLVCTAFAYKYMIGLRPGGFVWCVVHLILCSAYWTTNATLNLGYVYDSDVSGYALLAAIFFVIYTGGWGIPNYLYFRKRRALFRAYTPREIAYARGQWHSIS